MLRLKMWLSRVQLAAATRILRTGIARAEKLALRALVRLDVLLLQQAEKNAIFAEQSADKAEQYLKEWQQVRT